MYAIARLMMNLPAGILADRYGRKPLLVWGPLITAFGERNSSLCNHPLYGVHMHPITAAAVDPTQKETTGLLGRNSIFWHALTGHNFQYRHFVRRPGSSHSW